MLEQGEREKKLRDCKVFCQGWTDSKKANGAQDALDL